jgi:hypothetical protein
VAGRLAGAIILSIFGVVLTDGARAQIVTNGKFEVPSVASALDGYLFGPAPALNVSGAGWIFPSVAGGYSGITIVGSAGAFTAPSTPDSSQVGLIVNLGEISQPVKLPPGAYTLSFKLAQRTGGFLQGQPTSTPLPISVSIGEQKFGPFSPTSATSYNAVSVPFQIPAGGSGLYGLNFAGAGVPYQASVNSQTTFIDAVSITATLPPNPLITAAPSDIDPTSALFVQGLNLWPPPVQVHVKFPNPSEVNFSNGSKSEIDLDVAVDHPDLKAVQTERIDAKYPYGKVNEQTVDIFVTADGGKITSPVWHAKFHDNAVITSGPATITPGQEFNLQGWDFDSKDQCGQNDKRGTVTVHFSKKAVAQFPNQGNNASDTDLVIQIPKGDDCQPDAVKVLLPVGTGGVVEQQVEIFYESPAGRKSNAWSAKFQPRKILSWIQSQPPGAISVTCSSNSHLDACNNPSQTGVRDCFPDYGTTGTQTEELTFEGYHLGCWGFSSDNGTDQFGASVWNGWKIKAFQYIDISGNDNASTSYVLSPQPSGTVNPASINTGNPAVDPSTGRLQYPVFVFDPEQSVFNLTVNWHVGADGGEAWYWGYVFIEGPQGIPSAHPVPGISQ